jgi:hypothetical protein
LESFGRAFDYAFGPALFPLLAHQARLVVQSALAHEGEPAGLGVGAQEVG